MLSGVKRRKSKKLWMNGSASTRRPGRCAACSPTSVGCPLSSILRRYDVPSAETEALAQATGDDGTVDTVAYQAEYRRVLSKRQGRLVREAQALLQAMDGWSAIETAEDWDRTVVQADEDLQSGAFLIERLGGQRYVDPALMATLYVLRRQLIEEHGATTAAELMMIDSTLLAYFHMLKINGWIGNLAAAAESEMFGRASLTTKLEKQHGRGATVRGLRVEELVQRLSEHLMPLMERSNRMMLRNLKALKEHRRPPTPNLNINQAQQVNVGTQQVNVAASDE
jgi:hypothetical protein